MNQNNIMWFITGKILFRHNMLANLITASLVSIVFGITQVYAYVTGQYWQQLALWDYKISLLVTALIIHLVFVNWYAVKRVMEQDHPEFTIVITPSEELLDEVNRRNHQTV